MMIKRLMQIGFLYIAVFTTNSYAAFPEKPVTLIVPYASGGMSSVFGPIMAEAVEPRLGQRMIVEYKPGANGGLGAAYVAKSKPDGYTLLMGVNSTMAINPNLYDKVLYDPIKDFSPVAMLYRSANILVVKADSPFNSVRDVIDYAKQHPGKLNFGSSGKGATPHLSGEMFKKRADIEMTHVPYKGVGPALIGLIGGEVDMVFSDLSAMAHIQNGTLKPLAVTSAQRLQAAPEVPTMQEAGVKDFLISTWYSIVAPAGTPPGIVKTLNDAFSKAVQMPKVKERMAGVGMEPVPDTSSKFLKKSVKSDLDYWKRFLQEAKIEMK